MAASLLRTLSRWSRWSPLIETSDRLSWLVFPLVLQFALQNIRIPLPPWAWQGLMGAIHIAYVVILVGWLRSFAYAGLEWTVGRAGASHALQAGFIPLIRNSITLVALTLGLILVLQHFGFDVMGLVTALGVGSLAVGLAAKDTLSNMISGFTLILDQNFRPGERVSVGGSSGIVEEIGLRSTRIRSPVGGTWVVPNSELANTRILNSGMPSQGQLVTTTLRVTPETDFVRAQTLINRLIDSMNTVDKKKQRLAVLQSVADGNQSILVTFWVQDPTQADAALSDFLWQWMSSARSQGITPSGSEPKPL
ncbi:MAG: mechanosensitive ion channel family protein [Oligoflexia bacterium]